MSKAYGFVVKKYRHRWTATECKKMLDFIEQNPFEQPNSMNYYRKLAKVLRNELHPRVIQNKINSMLRSYQNARTLKIVNTDIPMSEVAQICPFYKQLGKIFEKQGEIQAQSHSQEDAKTELMANGAEVEKPADELAPIKVEECTPNTLDEIVTDPQIDKPSLPHEYRLLELRVREKEINLRYFEIQSSERILRLEWESKERIAMKKLDLRLQKYLN